MPTKYETEAYDDLNLTDRFGYAMVPKAGYDIGKKRLARLRLASLVVLIGLPFLSILMTVLIAYDDAAWTDNFFLIVSVFSIIVILAVSAFVVIFDNFGRRILHVTVGSLSMMERQRWAKGPKGKARLSKVLPNEWEIQIVKDACLWSYSRILIAIFVAFASVHLVIIGLDLFFPDSAILRPIFTVRSIAGVALTAVYMMIVLPIARIVWTLPSLEDE